MTTWDDKPNDYEHACREIERLRDALATCRELRKWDRNAIIEECASVAELYQSDKWCAAAIRALIKDKP